MFQILLDQVHHRRTELLEFEQKLNRLRNRLEDQSRRIEAMESFSDICTWLLRTEEQLEAQTGQVKELGTALESVIRLFRSSEQRILEQLEDGTVEKEDSRLHFTVVERPEKCWDFIRF